jgi:lantibiotic modifying enzyme
MLKKGFTAFVVSGLLSLPVFAQKQAKFLHAALKVERWLQSQSINKGDSGLAWHNTKDSAFYTAELYSGNGGVILFYLELYNATRDQRYLQKAEQGFHHLKLTQSSDLNEDNVGLYTGQAGIVYTASQLAIATGKKQYRDDAANMLSLLNKQILHNDTMPGQMANDIIYGYAGIGLVYLYAQAHHLQNDALHKAVLLGDLLLNRTTQGKTGIRWPMFMKDTLRKVYYPNFSHGTAGVAYFMTELYAVTKDNKYLEAALKAASHLQSITNDSGWVYHIEPHAQDRYYLSWCHGPAGTSRLYYKLHQLTKDSQWTRKMQQAAQAVMKCGIPEKQTKGYWNNLGACCGGAGIADYFLYLYKIFKKDEYWQFSRHMMNDILKKATANSNQLSWLQAENRSQPNVLAAQTGLMQGAAGIGLALLHQYYVAIKKKPAIVLPDNPFE